MRHLVHIGVNFILDTYKLVTLIPNYANFLLFSWEKEQELITIYLGSLFEKLQKLWTIQVSAEPYWYFQITHNVGHHTELP